MQIEMLGIKLTRLKVKLEKSSALCEQVRSCLQDVSEALIRFIATGDDDQYRNKQWESTAA